MKKTCKKENGNMNFIVEENAIYYMDENRGKKRRGNISETG